MSKITAIKQQIKKADRYAVFVDGKYSFSLSENELIASGIHSGQELTELELEKLKDTSKLDKARSRVIDLIARRPRSIYEIQTYLKRKGQGSLQTDMVVESCIKLGLLDDQKFATSWVESRRLLKPTSHRKLRLELRQKGISSEIIDKTLEADETTDSQTLQQLIERKRRQTKYQDNQKLMQYLARQGFGYSDIKSSLEDLNNN